MTFNGHFFAGVPSGVLSFLPSDGPVFGDAITSSRHLAAINFTGSVPTFKTLWKKVGQNLDTFTTFPRLIGGAVFWFLRSLDSECGGKNFHLVHPSAHVDAVVTGTIRSAFEYGGQKCSACSRIYVPESLWPVIKKGLGELHAKLKLGDVSWLWCVSSL